MAVIRHDGTRLLTYDDINRDFDGKIVLLDVRDFPNQIKGYLLASADVSNENHRLMFELCMFEYGVDGMILAGSQLESRTMLGTYY